MNVGGEGGIRTHGTVTRTLDFESSPFGHSGTSPPRSLTAHVGERQSRSRSKCADIGSRIIGTSANCDALGCLRASTAATIRRDLWRWHSSTNRRVARLMMPTLSSDGEA